MSADRDDANTRQAEEAIRLLYKEYGDCLLAGDADRYAAMWTEDGIRIPTDQPNVVGRDAILDGSRAILAKVKYLSFNIEVQEIMVSGQQAFGCGTFTNSVAGHSDQSEVIKRRGKFLSIFLRGADGLWKFHRDFYQVEEDT